MKYNGITKTTRRITIFAILCLLLQSCENYLQENMVSDVSASYYTTEAGLSAGVNACYSFLKDQYYGQECGMSLTVFGTDTYTNGSDGDHKSLNQYDFDPSNDYVQNLWNSMYKAINQCNAVVDRSGKVTDGDASTTDELVAEARFLRALYYFTLVRQYGDVHLTLSETLGVETEANKTSRDSIYQKAIIPDLRYACAILPETQSDYGRATKGAAQFLLAKVYLTYGWSTGKQQYFENSVSYADSVINSGTYSLLDNYADLWDVDNQENKEVIFSVQNTTDKLSNGNGIGAHMFFLMAYDVEPGMQRSTEYGRPWKRFTPTEYCLSLWNKEYDSRYYKSFQQVWYANNPSTLLPEESVGDTSLFMPGVNVGDYYYAADANGNRVKRKLSQKYYSDRDGKSMTIFTPDKYTLTIFPTLVKYLDPQRASVNDMDGTRDVVVMRFAEAYLVAAEASFKLGDNSEAAQLLNVVRERAAWPGFKSQMDITASDVTLNFILEERARELSGEMQRWYDLTRTGTLIERVKDYCNALNYVNYSADNIKEKHLLRPIPQSQIDLSTNDYAQNPGW